MKNVLLAVIFIVIIVIGILGLPALLRYFLGVDQPVMTVVSGSMWPKLSRGDIIFVMKADDADIEVGSVIIFRHENGMAVHRVVRIDGWTITTRGDANVKEDNPIMYDDVVGRVPAIGSRLVKIPWIGHIALLANPQGGTVEPGEEVQVDFWGQLLNIVLSPVGFIIMIGFPLLVVFQDPISEAITGIMPMSMRKRRLRMRTKRLQSAWGEEKTKRALRI